MDSSPPTTWGRLDHLNDEQLSALAHLWITILQFFQSNSPDTVVTDALIDSSSNATSLSASTQSTASPAASESPEVPAPGTSKAEKKTATVALLHRTFWLTIQDTHPHDLLLRFLRARKFNVHKARVMLFKALVWRVQVDTEQVIERGELGIKTYLLENGESFVHGVDKHNRPVIYINVALHDKKASTLPELEIMTIWLMETVRLMIHYPIENVCLVFNMKGFSSSNMDFPMTKFLVTCLQSYYPESLGQCLIVEAPWVFNGIFKLIKPLLDPVVMSKIKFIKAAELSQYISASDIPSPLNPNPSNTSAPDYSYTYQYVPPAAAEGSWTVDPAQKEKLVAKLLETAKGVEEYMRNWAEKVMNSTASKAGASNYSIPGKEEDVDLTKSGNTNGLREKDKEVLKPLVDAWKELDSMMRFKTFYHRTGVMAKMQPK
ncbi:CRAL-TRIO domain-containing protein [Paraphysoderma sedebokerense]|nr:CRAL-TRIO domain-containing protein [Paraphysoderma sedebokerense]